MQKSKQIISSLTLILILSLIFASVSQVSAGRGGSGGCGGGGCGGGGGGGSVIDPPPGQAFKDPVNLTDNNLDANIVEVNLEAKPAVVNINGVQANPLTYNGYYPGPTIYLKQGNILKVHFKNSLPTNGVNLLGFERGPNNIHTHGFHVSPEEPADAAHIAIPAGGTYNYEYNTMKHPSGSMNFYHCHIRGLVAEQYWAGLSGCLITEDPTNALAG